MQGYADFSCYALGLRNTEEAIKASINDIFCLQVWHDIERALGIQS